MTEDRRWSLEVRSVWGEFALDIIGKNLMSKLYKEKENT